MSPVTIKTFSPVVPMIYAYTTPGVTYHEGWTKIGYTEKQKVAARIAQQTHTAGLQVKVLWQDNAMYKDGSGQYFTDHDFHQYLETRKQVPRQPGTEWFQIDGPRSRACFDAFASRNQTPAPGTGSTYTLRKEQQEAVSLTQTYFKNGGAEFLWNAKPRFGKTLAAYDLIMQMGFSRVLVVTNRPSIANSWAEDFNKFIGWRGKLRFVSDTDALKGKPGVMTRSDYQKSLSGHAGDAPGMIAFESLQGLKGSVYFGGDFDKLKWISALDFDLLIVDEAHEGVETAKTERAFKNISRKHTLYLSGTPFKALASALFAEDQIFNWSYADEQDAKASWSGEDYNPYEALPRLAMFTYQLSPMIYDEIVRGADVSGDGEKNDYAFDLNAFFATGESGKLTHEAEVKKFLHALVTQEKYPFSTPELRRELAHTLWLLNRVDSAKALSRLLKADPVFGDYKIVLAAGDGHLDDDAEDSKAFDKVKRAIAENDKTITLSVGQLTVGVTIPEWSGVLMLCNLKSPSSYMQAAFRAQNPCSFTDRAGHRYRKETAYVFDFDPARTLIIFDAFANNLQVDTAAGAGTDNDRKRNIKRLLNFFPVLGEDTEGKMIELDAAEVLRIPVKIKSTEVVRRGFMSNFLFQNISNIFGAPGIIREIVEKLNPAEEEKRKKDKDSPLKDLDGIPVDHNGDVQLDDAIVIGTTQDLFGDKIYDTMTENLAPALSAVKESAPSQMAVEAKKLADTFKQSISANYIAPVAQNYDIKKSARNRLEKKVTREIDHAFDTMNADFLQQTKVAQAEYQKEKQTAETEAQVRKADAAYDNAMAEASKAFMDTMQKTVQKTIDEKPRELVEQLERHKVREEKETMEDAVRAHLRGFSRTIPSFIMAYGDNALTLHNFDDYTEDDVFQEVTGITEAQFRFLRDGGDYQNEETGKTEHFDGHLFDATVFDDAIQAFLEKKEALSNYFDEGQSEDIFDYIPPQKTNQIFTPKGVVIKMVDELAANNPGCFDDPTHTFADLYMKSGLYITEIVKRLFNSKKMGALYPDKHQRIRHILEKQVYGMAPTRIIYLIATHYILGFDPELKAETSHFVQADAAEASKNGTLAALVDDAFADLN